MAIITDIRANEILFSKACEFTFESANAFVPLGSFRVSELSSAMDALCGASVKISFRTNTKHEADDLVKMTRRLKPVDGWEFTNWTHPTIRGFVMDSHYECTATRKVTA